MRILHMANHCRNCGNGIVNVAVDLACYQAVAGHDVFFASSGGEYADLFSFHAITFLTINQKMRMPATYLRGVPALFRVLLETKPDIVHAHMVGGFLMARILQPLFRYKLVTTMHNEFQRSTDVMRFADVTIAVSGAVANALLQRKFDPGKVITIRNGVLGGARRKDDGGAHADLHHPSIVTAAGLYVRKGIADLIEAFALIADAHPFAHLYVLGDGPLRGELRTLAASVPSGERIHFEGFVTRPETYFRSAEIFVLPSHNEPFGLVLIEARSAGCAVVGTSVGGIVEVLEQGRNGLLVPPGKPVELAAVLTRLLSDEAERSSWALAAQRNLEHYSVARMGNETIALYEQLLDCPAMKRSRLFSIAALAGFRRRSMSVDPHASSSQTASRPRRPWRRRA